MDTNVVLLNMYLHPSNCHKHYGSSGKSCETRPIWCDPVPSTTTERMTAETAHVQDHRFKNIGISTVQISVFGLHR
jgi:hypothetical protein